MLRIGEARFGCCRVIIVMHPKEEELRELANRVPFVPFTLVTASGDRYKVLTADPIFFAPNIDDDGTPDSASPLSRHSEALGFGVSAVGDR